MEEQTRALGAAEAARHVVAALDGGRAAAVVLLVDAAGPLAARVGGRVLVDESGGVRGSFGDAELDKYAAERARESLALALPEAGTVAWVLPGGAEATLYVEPHQPRPELLIVGAGHIAVPLASLGALLGYRVSVLDDREEFATEERFPEAAEVRRMDFDDPFRGARIGARTHVVLVTRAHRYDYDCLRRLLDLETLPRYIGMIGSRRRVRAAFQALLDAGVPREKVARVRAPLGIDVGAETPAEIAVSIAAELIALRRGVPVPASLAEHERVLDRLLPEKEA